MLRLASITFFSGLLAAVCLWVSCINLGCTAAQIKDFQAKQPALKKDLTEVAESVPGAIAGNYAPLISSVWNTASLLLGVGGGAAATVVVKRSKRAGKRERQTDRTPTPPPPPPILTLNTKAA